MGTAAITAGRPRRSSGLAPLAAPYALACTIMLAACGSAGRAPETKRRVEPVYDPQTGRLTLLKYDSQGGGKPDTFCYMDGSRVVRIEVDEDGDGRIDRWEYYGPGQQLEKIGFSRANDGKVDAWSYLNSDGSVSRIELSTRRDGRVDRIEHYEHDVLVRAEEDTDGDGIVDKWETYEGGRLASVAFDTAHHGRPDRRLVYGSSGQVRVEVDRGDGRFVAVPSDPRVEQDDSRLEGAQTRE